MEKEFVPYEESYQLKTLGFAEPCFAYYGEINGGEIELFLKRNFDTEAKYLLAPTFSQAFRWFREKHDLVHHINRDGGWWLCSILDLYDEEEQGTIETHIDNCYPDTYEEAELACLCTLIKIVKNK